jgi:GTP-binding protein EngB required for normal cell division
MDTTRDLFKARQDQAAALLSNLLQFVEQGRDVGVPLDDAFKTKLESAIGAISGEKLRVALVGGFSEGKTAIAAAWMDRLDKESMQIDQRESTGEVTVYEVGQDFVLIDTPGLFGFKEDADGEKYKDMTRKYVSEAHLVLYVMDPTNPIKDSHKIELQWLFRELDLLQRTVFVLSRFDDVADVEDDASYDAALRIKRDAVRQRLTELIGLDAQEAAALSIVGVSANPFNQGMEYWLSNRDQHKQLSRIGTLQQATAEKIKTSGGAQALAIEMRRSIIGDVLTKHLPIAIERGNGISAEVTRLTDAVSELQRKADSAKDQTSRAGAKIRAFLADYFKDLILQAQGADLQTWNDFFQREVGAEGIIIHMRLQNEYEQHLRSAQVSLQSVQSSFVDEVNHFNTMISGMGKQGVKFLIDGKVINNKSILMVRDGVVSISKTVGFDLSKSLKFKPWGASKLADGANGALAGLGILLEGWDSWQKHERETKFREGVKEFVESLEAQRKSLAAELVGDGIESTFIRTYFPDMLEIISALASLESALEDMRGQEERFGQWFGQAKVLQGEYKLLAKD